MPHRHHHGMSAKALKTALKHAGLKTTGRKSALTKRAKKAHLLGHMHGGGSGADLTLTPATLTGGRRRHTRRRRTRHFPFA